MKKVIIYLADGFEEIEALGTADILRRGGAEVKIVSIKNDKNLIGSNNIKIIADEIIDNINENDYDMIVFPGGMENAKSLADSEKVINIIKKFNEQGKLIASICASPAFAINKSGIAKKRKITCYPGLEDRLKDSNYVEENAVTDGNLTTSRGPATTFEFAYKLLDELGLDSQSVKKGMLYTK